MDDIRDIQRRENVSRIFENGLKTRPFGGNIAAERAYTRAERCAAAIHLVTNHIPANEPARASARRGAIELLSHVLNLRNELRTGGRALQETIISIRKQISIMRLLSVGGFVSIQNIEVLVEALDELANILERSQRSALSENIVLKSDDFISAGPADIKDTQRTPMSSVNSAEADIRAVSVSKRTSMRGNSILAVLKVRGGSGIKDIAASLPEYSEKMIQRELARLIREKKVSKSGSKRWSMYALVV